MGNLCWDTYHNQVKSTKSFVSVKEEEVVLILEIGCVYLNCNPYDPSVSKPS